jgi:hypothetical protein
MKIPFAVLLAWGISCGLSDRAQAAVVSSAAAVDPLVVDAGFLARPVDQAPLQLARHCGPPRGYYYRGGHHHHHRGIPYGAYYRGGYGYGYGHGPGYYYPAPAYPVPYGGTSFGLYIGF